MSVSVVIPARDEEDGIGDVLSMIPPDILEVIVVDDGSIDNTPKIAKEKKAKVIKTGEKMGKGAALRLGMEEAKGEIVVFMDGDGQHDPTSINELVMPIKEGRYRMVIGNRFHQGYRGTPLMRIISNYFSRILVSISMGYLVPDPLCGFRAFVREDCRGLRFGDGFEIELMLVYHFKELGLNVGNVPVPLIYKNHRSHMDFSQNISLAIFLLEKTIIRFFSRLFGRS